MRYYRIVVTDPTVSQTGRNDPCPCGSGVKYKKCHGGRKPRTRTITLDYGRSLEPGSFDEVFLSAGTVQLRRFGVPIVPISATTEESYERDKRAKVLYRFPQRAMRAGTNPNVLLEAYQHVFAIDTNTRETPEGTLSVTAAIHCRLTVKDTKLLAEPFEAGAGTWQCLGAAEPEKSAWHMFLDLAQRDPNVKPRDRVALIVDHDLEHLDAYNNRTLPIHRDFFLPENVDLIYAAEKGSDFLGSTLIRLCDQKAARELRSLVRRGAVIASQDGARDRLPAQTKSATA